MSLKSFFKFFKSTGNAPDKRRYLKDINEGEYIRIEWYRIKGKIGEVKCINNDNKTRKLFLEVNWNTGIKEQFILDYDSEELVNFNLLNPIVDESDESPENFHIEELQKIISEAIEKEEYERVTELHNNISKILKKQS